ncbi:hypothetical protein JAU75_18380 [Ochrobactrum sp. Q0168]|uniref:hypothetical protein n=1 Tax=Ochrobactrum sp. Q0168 TaxID=2793241 RepID=UPI0018EB8ADA|nr:hypothetical protein [Ochrobactrum sp. Q0168]
MKVQFVVDLFDVTVPSERPAWSNGGSVFFSRVHPPVDAINEWAADAGGHAG